MPGSGKVNDFISTKMTFLYERDDFPELIEGAASFHAIQNPAIIEKDYYVTEALRLIGQSYGDQIIFKGGTSLSKGWKLVSRAEPFRPNNAKSDLSWQSFSGNKASLLKVTNWTHFFCPYCISGGQ
jgi:hypothetical protein